MASKDNLLAELQDYADTSGDDSVKASLGTPGDYVEIDNVARPTGAAYATPGVIDGLLTAIGAVIDSLISGGGAGTVKITISDATSGYLASKLVAGNGIILTVHTGVDSDQTLEVAADFGTGAGDVCEGNDARLSDARTPTAHHDSHVDGTDTIPAATESAPGLCPTLDGEATHYLDGTGNWSAPAGGEGDFPGFGTTAGTCAEGDDSRLSDDRTASGLRTKTTIVSVSTSAAPAKGGILVASASDSAAWQSNLWVTAFDIDLAAEPDQSLPNNTDYTIGGVVFTRINQAYDRVPMAIVNGAGLVMQPAKGALGSICDWWNTNHTPIGLQRSLASIYPKIAPTTRLRAWMYIATDNFSANYDGCGIGFDLPGTGVSTQYGHYTSRRQYYNGTRPIPTVEYNDIGYDNHGLATGLTSYDVFMLELPNGIMGHTALYFLGSYSAGWPAVTALRSMALVLSTGSTVYDKTAFDTLADWNFIIGAYTGSSPYGSAACSVTIGRIRLDYASV